MTINKDRRINSGSIIKKKETVLVILKNRKLQKHVHSQNIEKYFFFVLSFFFNGIQIILVKYIIKSRNKEKERV